MVKKISQKGSGYSSDPSQNIGKQLVYKAYNDCNPPSIIGGTLKMTNCNQSGGKKSTKRKSSSKRKSSKRKSSKRKSSKQCGGMPSKFPFSGKQKSVYSGDMKDRTFGGRQPSWKSTDV